MDNNNNPKPIQLPELIASLEQATVMARQLPFTTTDPSLFPQIYSSFHAAHHRLSSFLFSSSTSAAAVDNSLSSDTNNNTNKATAAEPMQFDVHDVDNQEADSKQNNNNDDDIMIETVEERMRNCFIKNKRLKRALSPSYAAVAAAEEERRSRGVRDGTMTGLGRGLGLGFDPMETRLNALELVYQFHG